MDISDFLTRDRVLLDVRARDKKQLIGEIARAFERSMPGLKGDVTEAALRAREQLGSTGLGGGFALPHARIQGIDFYAGLFVRLAKPIEFDAIDGKPVTLIFVLLIPFESTEPHVAALAAISRRFRDVGFLTNLRRTKSQPEAYDLVIS